MIQPTIKISDLPFFDLSTCVVSELPIQFAETLWMKHHKVLPLSLEDKKLVMAVDRSLSKEALQTIQFHTEFDISWVVAESEPLEALRQIILNQNQHKAEEKQHSFSVKDFVQHLLKEAIAKRASDVHFEPYEKFYRVRFRLDGLLCEITSAPLSMHERITAYLKVMAHLDTSERRLPQDGRFQLQDANGHGIDCRINTCPTVNGEKMVVRLLHRSNMQRDIDSLGFNEEQKNIFLQALKQPQGMIFVTGPTGSGKTATLYTALHYLNAPERNISTIEDPVEIKLSGINQVGVNIKAGMTFSKAVRAFLRQDPDVIMIGEIRDLETAQIAVNAAQTGHLVLSTLHANGAIETIARMMHLGIPSFQIADSVKLIIAQRLARKLCENCKKSGMSSEKSCSYCYRGYKGRVGLFEILPVNLAFCEQIALGADSMVLSQLAKQSGMISLYESGLEKIAQGLTSLEEVQRVIAL